MSQDKPVLTAEEIEEWRVVLCDEEEFHAQALAEINALCDLALSALALQSELDKVRKYLIQLRVRVSENCTNKEVLATIDSAIEDSKSSAGKLG